MNIKALFASFFSTKEIDEAAAALCDLFMKHVNLKQSRKSEQIDRAYGYVLAQAKGEKRRREWRGAAAARLSNKFGWNLIEHGFPKDDAIKLARKLAIDLAKEKKLLN